MGEMVNWGGGGGREARRGESVKESVKEKKERRALALW